MSKIVLDTIASGYNLAKINDNFTKIAAALNDEVLYRDVPSGETNTVKNDIDMDSNNLLNVGDLRVLGTATIDGINFDAVNSALVWRGAWNSFTSYAISDAVSYNGSSYISIATSLNSAPPSASWELLAQQGSSGAGTGDVTGPSSSVSGAIAVFANGTGKTISDSGILPSTLAVKGALGSSGITGAVPTGVITTSGLTQATSRILGRTTASTGAIEELSVDSSLNLASGVLGVKAGGVTPAMLSQPLTLGTAVATTSSTSIDFTGIPSWANRITISCADISTGGTSALLVQLGDSGGIETTGYAGQYTLLTNTSSVGTGALSSGFRCGIYNVNTETNSGAWTLVRVTGNTWCCTAQVANAAYNSVSTCAGSKTLTNALDRIRLTTVSGDTFDAGSVNILYE